MENNKEKIWAIGGTLLFHILVILFLFFYYLKPVVQDRQSQDLEGIPVMFGNVADAFGDKPPIGRSSIQSQSSTNSATIAKDALLAHTSPNQSVAAQTKKAGSYKTPDTQDMEKTVSSQNNTQQKTSIESPADKQQREAVAEAKKQAMMKSKINQEVASLFGNGDTNGSRGGTQGSGTQGSVSGNANYGKTSGVGGWGSFDLGGRSLGQGGLIKPSYKVDDYGTVVVDILVDPNGNVVDANIGRGTNTPSAILKSEALKAARKTKFNAVTSFTNQKGTITYMFNLN